MDDLVGFRSQLGRLRDSQEIVPDDEDRISVSLEALCDVLLTGHEAADRILALSERIAVLEGLISEKSIERLAEDIAVAVTDPLHVTETRHSAMVRLGERLRNPLPADLRASLIGSYHFDKTQPTP